GSAGLRVRPETCRAGRRTYPARGPHDRRPGLISAISEQILMRALNIAATGMAAQQLRVEVISHNLANMNTTAYNARRAEFADLHYQQVQRPGTINAADGAVLPAGVQLGLGVRTTAVSMQVEHGTLTETGGVLDLAIEGRGYLEVVLPNGDPAWTRDGALKRNGEGLIVTSDGFPVQPEIVIPEDARDITINADGQV